jgi:hypothetical protein
MTTMEIWSLAGVRQANDGSPLGTRDTVQKRKSLFYFDGCRAPLVRVVGVI